MSGSVAAGVESLPGSPTRARWADVLSEAGDSDYELDVALDTVSKDEVLASVGSALHASGECKPCAFVHTKGCSSGASCRFCHVCPPNEKNNRKLARRNNASGNANTTNGKNRPKLWQKADLPVPPRGDRNDSGSVAGSSTVSTADGASETPRRPGSPGSGAGDDAWSSWTGSAAPTPKAGQANDSRAQSKSPATPAAQGVQPLAPAAALALVGPQVAHSAPQVSPTNSLLCTTPTAGASAMQDASQQMVNAEFARQQAAMCAAMCPQAVASDPCAFGWAPQAMLGAQWCVPEVFPVVHASAPEQTGTAASVPANAAMLSTTPSSSMTMHARSDLSFAQSQRAFIVPQQPHQGYEAYFQYWGQ